MVTRQALRHGHLLAKRVALLPGGLLCAAAPRLLALPDGHLLLHLVDVRIEPEAAVRDHSGVRIIELFPWVLEHHLGLVFCCVRHLRSTTDSQLFFGSSFIPADQAHLFEELGVDHAPALARLL